MHLRIAKGNTFRGTVTVTGQAPAESSAKSAIKRSHCRVCSVRYVNSRKIKKGAGRPGKVLPVNSKINLVVSRGPKP